MCVCERQTVYECVYTMQRGWIIFISLQLVWPPLPSTTILNATTSPKLFSLPHCSEPLFKNTVTLFPLFHCVCVCVLFTLSSSFTQTHTHCHTHMFPLTSFLRQFIWLTGKKSKEKTDLLEILKCHTEEDWAGCCCLRSLILTLISYSYPPPVSPPLSIPNCLHLNAL